MPLAANGQAPVYAKLYGGKGSLIGWLSLTDGSESDVVGSLLWTKRGGVPGAFYPLGFTNVVQTLGSRYTVPLAGTPVLSFGNGTVVLDGGNLISPLNAGVAISALNKITVTTANTNKLALTIAAGTGRVAGSFINPDTRKASAITGVVLRRQDKIGGFFRGTNQSGLFFLGRPEDFPLFAP
jgi:hypothetical protein